MKTTNATNVEHLSCGDLNLNSSFPFLFTLLVFQAVIIGSLLLYAYIRSMQGKGDDHGILIFRGYFYFLCAITASSIGRACILLFTNKSSKEWQILQTIVWNGVEAALRDGFCIFLAQKSAGKVAVQRTVAFSLLWAFFISFNGGYWTLKSNPSLQPYLGLPLLYWHIHDIAIISLHLILLLLFLRPSMARRSAKAWTYSASLFVSYVLFEVTIVLVGRGDYSSAGCEVMIAQFFYYFINVPIAYISCRADAQYWRHLGQHRPKKKRALRVSALPNEVRQIVSSSSAGSDEFDFIIDFAKLHRYELLGVGAAAHVYRGKFRDREVAIKKYHVETLTEKVVEAYLHEIELTVELAHPNIVKAFGVSVQVPDIAIVLELLEFGALFEYIHKLKRQSTTADLYISYAQMLRHSLDIALAVEHIHAHSIVHCDLKSLNCFVSSNPVLVVKVGDFGESRRLRDDGSIDGTPGQTTIQWCAPEVLRDPKALSFASDIYSCAIIFWELATGTAPYPETAPWRVGIDVSMQGRRPFLPPSSTIAELASLIERMWETSPSARPSASDVVCELRNIMKANGVEVLMHSPEAVAKWQPASIERASINHRYDTR